jgi:DNA-binding beta-propeller fold protein YncE
MTKHIRFVFPLLAAVALVVWGTAVAKAHEDHDEFGPYQLITSISIPGFGNGFDISWVDSEAGRYYLADRGNPTATPPVPPRIDVIDTRHLSLLPSLLVHAAPNGLMVIRTSKDDDSEEGGKELWLGDTNSFVEVIDLKSGSIVADISTGGQNRADELAYDPRHHIVLVANDLEATPFVTFISQTTKTVLGTLLYPQAAGFGLEQPVWNPRTKKFYLSVPGTTTNPQGEVDEIDPVKRMVTRVFPAACNAGEAPQGLALIPHQRLVTSCGDIIRVRDGKVLTTVPGVGIDEIWFNPGDERVYFGGGPDFIQHSTVPVLDTETETVVAVIPVGTPPPPLRFTHSVAVDSENNRVFVPISGVGVKVYAAATDENEDGDR